MKKFLLSAFIVSFILISLHSFGQVPPPKPNAGGTAMPPPPLPDFNLVYDSLSKASNIQDSAEILKRFSITPYIREGNAESVKDLINKVLDSKSVNALDNSILSVLYMNLSTVYSQEGNLIQSIELLLTALDFCISSDCEVLGGIYNNLGLIFSRLKNFDKAIEYYELSKINAGDRRTFPVDINLSRIYTELGNYDEAINILTPYISFEKVDPNNLFAYFAYYDAHFANDNYDEAYKIFQVIDPFMSRPVPPKMKYDVVRMKMSHFLKLENLDSAVYFADILQKNPFFRQDNYNGHIVVAETYLLAGKYDEALGLISYALGQIEGKLNERLRLSLLHLQSTVYEAKADYKNSLGSLRKALEIEKRVLSEDIERKVNAKEADYTLERIEKEKKILQANLDRKSAEQNFTITLLGFIFISLLLTYILFVKTSKSKKALEGKNKKIKQLMDELNHRVKNNLQLISSILNLQSSMVAQPQAKSLLTESKLRMQALSIMHQNLYREDSSTSVNCKKYFEELLENLKIAFSNDDKIVELNLDISDVEVNMDQLIPMGLIINELATNSLKYADANPLHLNLVVQRQNDKINFEFSDNGGAIDLAQIKSKDSFGMEMVNSLVEQLDGHIETKNQSGLMYNISFDY